jgi:hypothetical protein
MNELRFRQIKPGDKIRLLPSLDEEKYEHFPYYVNDNMRTFAGRIVTAAAPAYAWQKDFGTGQEYWAIRIREDDHGYNYVSALFIGTEQPVGLEELI